MIGQSNDWISDQLAWAVKSHIPAAVAVDKFDAEPGELVGWSHKIRRLHSASESDRRRMFARKYPLLAAGNALGVDLFLHLPCLPIRHDAQIRDPHHPAHQFK